MTFRSRKTRSFKYALPAVLAVWLLASGCSLETKIEDLNQLKKPKTSTGNQFGMKVSGGAQMLTGADTDAEISIGLKNRTIKGTDTDMEVTISGARPE